MKRADYNKTRRLATLSPRNHARLVRRGVRLLRKYPDQFQQLPRAICDIPTVWMVEMLLLKYARHLLPRRFRRSSVRWEHCADASLEAIHDATRRAGRYHELQELYR